MSRRDDRVSLIDMLNFAAEAKVILQDLPLLIEQLDTIIGDETP